MADDNDADRTAQLTGSPEPVARPMSGPQTGENVTVVDGKYRLGRLIGEGGMGAVYEAVHLGLGIPVAVKLLGEAFTGDLKAVSRFRREARAAAAIRHPNIVEVTDTGTDEDGVPFIVMELLSGESLSALLRREKVLGAATAATIAGQILAGLSAAHAKGVIHRDLKPGNILLTRCEDGTIQAKILDFGISKFFADSMPQDVTAVGAVIGTPRFMAPEQAIGQPDLDARVDLYAVGVLLYRMVTGKVPFTGKTPESIIQLILQGRPRLPREIRPDVPSALESVILKAMANNRDLRFQDARQFIQALQEAVPGAVGQPLRLSLPSENMAGSTVGGWTPSGPTGTFGGSDLRVPTAPSQWLEPALPTGPQAPGSIPTLVKEGIPRRRWHWVLLLCVGLLLSLGAAYLVYRSDGEKQATPAAAPGDGGPWGGPSLRLGITRYLPEGQLQSEHGRLVRYLSTSLRQRVELVIHEDWVDLSVELASGKLQVAALSSYNYVRAKRRWPALRLLATHVTSGGASYEGFVVVRSSSGIRSLDALKGSIFCYVSPTSTSGYLYPRALLRHHGLDPDVLFKATRFAGDHLSALKALMSGACDGAAVFTGIFFEAKKHGLSPEQFTVLATTERIPYDAYCASPAIEAGQVERIQGILLDLEADSDLARRVLGPNSRIKGFIRASDQDYDSVRKIEKYLDSPGSGQEKRKHK